MIDARDGSLAREFRQLAGRPPSSFVEPQTELGRALATGEPDECVR